MKIPKCAFLILCLCWCLTPSWASARATEEEKTASELLFYLAADDQILTPQQVQGFMARKDTAVSHLYSRLESERKKAIAERSGLLKINPEEQDRIIYKAHDIRRAALAEILALGEGVVPVLVEAVNSARQEITLGVIRGLRELKSDQSLSVLLDVLERNRWGYTRFSNRVRREAIISLGVIEVRDERWKKLMEEGLVDLDPQVRQMCRNIVSQGKDDWSIAQLNASWNHELKAYEKERNHARERGLVSVFDDGGSGSVSVLKALEDLLRCGLFPVTEVPDELFQRSDFLRLMLRYHSALPMGNRIKVLNLAFKEGQQGVIKCDALSAMEEKDKTNFSKNILSLLSLQENPDVLEKALLLLDQWNLTEGREQVKILAAMSRRESVKNLAQKILQTL